MLPPLPKRQQFPDPVQHIAKKELHKEIRDAILNLYKRIKNDTVKEGVLSFASHIQPSAILDVARLPYCAMKPTSSKNNRATCLYAKLSWLIQLHWRFVQGEQTEQEIRLLLDYLNVLDYENNKITGDEKVGYELQKEKP